MPTLSDEFGKALKERQSVYGVQLADPAQEKLAKYYELLLKWNDRLHLVARCSPAEFATRHVLESLMLLRHLSPGARVADIGSGAGLPIIPCLIARQDIRAILFESSTRKAVFLREALKAVDCTNRGDVVAQRFQATVAPDVEFITGRAIDRFEQLLPELLDWSPPESTLALFVGANLVELVQTKMRSISIEKIPNSDRRFLVVSHPGRNPAASA